MQNYLRNWIFSVKPIRAFTGYSQSRGYGDISVDDSLNKVWQTEGLVICVTSLHLVYYYVILFHISFGFPYGYVLYGHFSCNLRFLLLTILAIKHLCSWNLPESLILIIFKASSIETNSSLLFCPPGHGLKSVLVITSISLRLEDLYGEFFPFHSFFLIIFSHL